VHIQECRAVRSQLHSSRRQIIQRLHRINIEDQAIPPQINYDFAPYRYRIDDNEHAIKLYTPEDITDFLELESTNNEKDMPYGINQLYHRLAPDDFIDEAIRNKLALCSAQEEPAVTEAGLITVLRGVADFVGLI
jgi:hypothetical protein